MKNKEIIWRAILEQALIKKTTRFTQKELAERYQLSTSTVFAALSAPRQLGAIEVTGRYFELRNFEKLLYLWATMRNLPANITYQTYVPSDVPSFEAAMPPSVIYAAYSAYRRHFLDAPADYDKVYVYATDLTPIKKRFPPRPGQPNLIVLRPDPFLKEYGLVTPYSQTFVDLWNIKDWFAIEFIKALKQKLHGILS